jgi:feruloyl esterase
VSNRLSLRSIAVTIALGTMSFMALPAFAATCESLATMKLADTTITSAQQVAAGAFIPPGATEPPPSVRGLPAFCRVMLAIKPARDSDIKVEVWLPLTGWNGKYRGQGNGGFAGQIYYPGMAVAIAKGYASAPIQAMPALPLTQGGRSAIPIRSSTSAGGRSTR